jgi:large subunit ribosomal protein L28
VGSNLRIRGTFLECGDEKLGPKLHGGQSHGFEPFGAIPKISLDKAGHASLLANLLTHSISMSRICAVTGKGPVKGNNIHRKGQSKKSGGIGTHITTITPRKFRPNLQRIKIKLPNGGTKRVLVSVKAIKAGLVEKAV